MKGSRQLIALGGLAGLAVVYFAGVRPRLGAQAAQEIQARAGNRPLVPVIIARRSTALVELLLPAVLRAYEDTPIYARTTGYIQKWLVDIGDRVKAGQILAVIDGPDLDQELNQARANLGQARANLEIARISAERWKDLGGQQAVAQQDVDQKSADYEARKADVAAAQANVDRLSQLKDYQNVTAPYDGVVTARNAQIGALITAGSGTEIYHVAQTNPLRVYTNVPQNNVRSIRPGIEAEVLVAEFPKESFAGRVTRLSGALDGGSRTLLTEVQIPNADGKLLPGMFGQVRFKLKAEEPAIIVPSNAAIVRAEGTLLAVVGADERIRLTHVRLGRDFGSEIEILGGIEPGARVVSNPSDSLADGVLVDSVEAPAARKD